jgi:cytoskeletal protein RodZ
MAHGIPWAYHTVQRDGKSGANTTERHHVAAVDQATRSRDQAETKIQNETENATMTSDLTTVFGNKIVRWLGGNAMPTAPTSLKIGIFNGNPKTTGVEVTDDIRAAGRVTATMTVPAVGTNNELTNSADVDFGDSDNDVTFSHAALYDQAGTSGSAVKFNIGNLTFAIGSAT